MLAMRCKERDESPTPAPLPGGEWILHYRAHVLCPRSVAHRPIYVDLPKPTIVRLVYPRLPLAKYKEGVFRNKVNTMSVAKDG